MMFRVAVSAMMLAAVAAMASQAVAAPIMSLSSPNDLTHLTVGSQAELDVTLQGLPAGNFIFNLNTQVLFPSTQFQLVSGPTATKTVGSVFFGPDAVANPQLANFNANSGARPSGGGVIGNFPDQSANGVGAIGQNGLFYSFIVRAISAGSGSVGFDLSNPAFNRYSGTDSGFAFAPLPTGPNVAFTIAPALAVPEPSTLVLAVTGAVSIGLGYGWRRRKRSAP